MKTIAIDFDGVIHKYSKGWHDGTIYDDEIDGVFETIKEFIDNGYSVFILSTRRATDIKKWLVPKVMVSEWFAHGIGDPHDISYPKYNFTVKVIPFWTKFWNVKGVVGITKRKLPADIYIDDRALRFTGDWNTTKVLAQRQKKELDCMFDTIKVPYIKNV